MTLLEILNEVIDNDLTYDPRIVDRCYMSDLYADRITHAELESTDSCKMIQEEFFDHTNGKRNVRLYMSTIGAVIVGLSTGTHKEITLAQYNLLLV
jgi:hypothetical protein